VSIGLKLYYLRSRSKQVTQTVMAKELGIRQATISNIEQDLSTPSLGLLLTLCKYFDVTPTFVLDDDGPLEPRPSDHWSNRHGLVTTGEYVEVPQSAVQNLGSSYLITLEPGTLILDEDAARARASGMSETQIAELSAIEKSKNQTKRNDLRRQLELERQASRLRRRGMPRSQAEGLLRARKQQ